MKEDGNDKIEKLKQLVEEYRKQILELQDEAMCLCGHRFAKSELCRMIVEQSEKKGYHDTPVPLASYVQREEIQKKVLEAFADGIFALKTLHPKLNDRDLLLLCLQASGLNNRAMAYCLGYPDIHALYKHKERVRKKI